MNLHEYQAKDILYKYNLPIHPYHVISSMQEAEAVSSNLQSAVAKVQVHAGGRGKAGGVLIAKTQEEIIEVVKQLLGMKFANNQTLGKALTVEKVLISPLVDIVKEYYIAITFDRKNKSMSLMVSLEGGIDIEEVADKNPEKILVVPISFYGKLRNFHIKQCCDFLGWNQDLELQGRLIFQGLVQAFYDNDASLLEINPLVLTTDNKLLILDTKMTIDENALYRHKDLAKLYDPTQENERDVIAKQKGLAYIALEGNIGCLVNGAGLAMGTLDILNFYGGKAANFLDVGGGASESQIYDAIELILSDDQVRVIFINIFGGIMDCSVVAAGVAKALAKQNSSIPVVVRLEGTNVDLGKEILANANLDFHAVSSMEEGASLSVKLTQG